MQLTTDHALCFFLNNRIVCPLARLIINSTIVSAVSRHGSQLDECAGQLQIWLFEPHSLTRDRRIPKAAVGNSRLRFVFVGEFVSENDEWERD